MIEPGSPAMRASRPHHWTAGISMFCILTNRYIGNCLHIHLYFYKTNCTRQYPRFFQWFILIFFLFHYNFLMHIVYSRNCFHDSLLGRDPRVSLEGAECVTWGGGGACGHQAGGGHAHRDQGRHKGQLFLDRSTPLGFEGVSLQHPLQRARPGS